MTLRKLSRILLIFLISVTGVLALLFASLNLPFSERAATRKVNQILERAKVPVHIHAIRQILPNSVHIEGIRIDDLDGDTIIYAHKLRADIRLLALLRNKVILEDVDLSQASVKILKKDNSLNLNISEAFTAGRSDKTKKKNKAKAFWSISIHDGSLSSVHFQISDSISGIQILQDIEEITIKNLSIPLADREIRANSLELNKSTGYVHLVSDASKEPDSIKKDQKPWNFALLNLGLENIDFTFDQDHGSLSMHLLLGEGDIEAKQMDLLGRIADLKSISLKRAMASVLTARPDQVSKSAAPDPDISPWFIQGKDVDLEEVDISFGNQEELELRDLELSLKDFLLDREHTALKLKRMSFDLGRGFSMKELKGELDSHPGSSILVLALETDHSQLQLEGVANQSITDIIARPGEIRKAKITMDKASISLKDLHPFVQGLDENSVIRTLSDNPYSLTGTIDWINSLVQVSGLSLSQDQNFLMSLEGEVENPFPIREARADLKLSITEVRSSWVQDLLLGFGLDLDPTDISGLTVESQVKNSLISPEFDLKVCSKLGDISSFGSMDFNTDSYSIQSGFENLRMGKILDIPDLGSLHGSVRISGQGFSRESLNSNLSLSLDSLEYNDYTYSGILVDGSMQAGIYDFYLMASDTFLAGDLKARMMPTDSVLQVKASGNLFAQLNELNLTEDTLSVKSKFDASLLYRQNFFESMLSASDLLLANPYQSDEIKQMRASFTTDSVNTTVKASGDFFTLDLKLEKPFSELETLGVDYRDYLSTFANPEHKNVSVRVSSLPEINASGRITDHEVFDIIVKDTGFHISSLDLSMQHHAAESRIDYGLIGHELSYEMIDLDSLVVALIDSAGRMNFKVLLNDISVFSGPENDVFLNGSFGNRSGTTSLSVIDPQDQSVYELDLVARTDSNGLILEVPSKSLIMNHQQWLMESADLLSVNASSRFLTPKLSMYTDSSFLRLYGSEEEGIRSYKLDVSEVEMESLVRNDLFPGRPDASISGSMELSIIGDGERRIASDLHFSHVDYSDLIFDEITLDGYMVYGDSGKYDLDVFARLDSAEIRLKGLKTENGERQIQSKISQVPINLLQPFTREILSDLKGFITGEFDVSRSGGSDHIDGHVAFQGVQLRINALNSSFIIPDQGVYVADEKLLFDKFRIMDTLSNELLIVGFLDFEKVDQLYTDLSISSSNLQLMSRGIGDDDKSFSGDIFVNSEFSVKGPLVDPSIRGNIFLVRGTELFYRHLDDFSMSESQKILSFNSKTDAENLSESPAINRQNTLNRSSLATRVDIDPSTRINISLSKKIYDLDLQIRGGGQLNYNMENNSQMSLSGRYEIGEGAAELKLVGWPNKNFRIQEGGFISWDGRLEDPELSFTALNRVSSSYLNPMDGQQRPVNFDVGLQLTDQLSDLEVLFTVTTNDQYLMSIINTLSPEEQMRQAISILLFEVIDLPGISSTSNYMSQQVNSILASQLNQFTQSAIKGVDISFGIDTYTTMQSGGEETNTSLSYEVRKSLLNDRANIEVSGRIRDMNQSPGATNYALNNITLEYSLDSAATKFLKVYNEHSYEDVFEGEVIKTGIGFFVRKRHRHLSDIWKREEKGNRGNRKNKENKGKE